MGFIYKDPTNLKIEKQQEKCCHGKGCWQMLPKTKSQVPLVMNIFRKF